MAITDLRDKKCLITGAASGIGRATADAAAREGADLYLADIDAARLDQAVSEIRAAGGKVSFHKAFDVSDFEAVKSFAADVHAAHGSMDVVMNIAGISIWGSILNLEHKHWKACVDINLMGPIHIMECFIPPMIAAKRGGHLVNVSSAAGLFGLPWHAAYSASKFGLRGVSEVLRFDLARHRIGVSLVCPGAVDTKLVRTVQIVGVDANHGEMGAMRERFRKHAISPEKAAACILKGIKKNQYMVLTSTDIGIGYWFQRKFAWPYEIVMRIMNQQLNAIAKRQKQAGAA